MRGGKMSEVRTALQILLRERPEVTPSIPQSLVKRVFDIEESVQFDEDRHEAPQRISEAVQALLEVESLSGPSGEHAD